MSFIKTITDFFDPEVWAIYIVAVLTVGFGLRQFWQQFRLGKKANVFDELSKEVQEAADLVNKIGGQMTAVVETLAAAANQASSNQPVEQSGIQVELERRLREIGVIADQQKQLLDISYTSFERVLLLIRKVEKSTVVSTGSRRAARHLFYMAQDQFELIKSAIDVLISMDVNPPVGQQLPITSKTFNAIIVLLNIINANNPTIANYLDDLSVILHNDLVWRLYGKAKNATIPTKHLTSKGVVDNRTQKSLL